MYTAAAVSSISPWNRVPEAQAEKNLRMHKRWKVENDNAKYKKYLREHESEMR